MQLPPDRRDPPAWSDGGLPALLVGVSGVVLTLLVASRSAPLVGVDDSIEADAHAAVLASPGLLEVARGATLLGGGVVRTLVTALVVLVLLARRRARLAVFLAVAVVGGAVLNKVLKALVHRMRPALPDPVAMAAGASFPSGHTMGSTVLVGALLVIVTPALPRPAAAALTAAGAFFVAAVAASRVLLGVHYVTDVTGGILFGALWVLVCAAALRVRPAPPSVRR